MSPKTESIEPLRPEQLYHASRLDGLEFESSDQLQPLEELLGQDRAFDSMAFGDFCNG